MKTDMNASKSKTLCKCECGCSCECECRCECRCKCGRKPKRVDRSREASKVLGTVMVLGMFTLWSCGGGAQKGGQADSSEVAKRVEQEKGAEENVFADYEENKTPRVFFKDLQDGDTVESPLVVEMGVDGMEVQPAGEVVEGVGHHHILINRDFVPKGEVIPEDETHLHFGKGQTSATLDLPPGNHTLCLQFADGAHASYGEELSKKISITVQKTESAP